MAERMELGINQRVLLISLGGATLTLTQPRVVQFEVRGIYETGMAEYDETYVFTNILNAQRLFGIGANVSGFDLLVQNVDNLDHLAEEIPVVLGYPYYARTMHQLYRNLFTWIELQKKPIPIILGLIIIVAVVNIIGTLLMMVMEKAKEIGILRALGTQRGTLAKIFLFQGMLIGCVGTLIGNGIAYTFCWLELKHRFFSLPSGIYYMTHVPIELSLLNFVLVSALALLLCFLASGAPSRFAASLDPISLLRFS